MRAYKPSCDENIETAIAAALGQAVLHGEPVRVTFNDDTFVVKPQDASDGGAAVLAAWHARRAAEHAAWEASPEGQAAKKEREKHDRRAAAFVAKGYATFDCVDPEGWAAGIAAQEGQEYALICYRYAAQWAHLMDAAMAKGKALEACAERCSHRADVEGISGYLHGEAVEILARCWRHGEALRRWHNLDMQRGTEGEEANASGGVLNLALLTIGAR